MAFWGTEVKPGKPYTHSFDRVRGRLRISQATLAIGTSTNKSLVQCNVGDKSPVLLCALLPDKTESLQLDLEFEETEDVIFSVIGPRGVHLTGYYVGGCRNSKFQDDTESYGEDINTDTEESNRCIDEDEDEYEDSFINDGEPEALTPSPASSDGVDEEVFVQKPRNGKGGRNRLTKKYQSVESDDETSSQQNNVNGSTVVTESDDEDKFPISTVCKSKTTATNTVPKKKQKELLREGKITNSLKERKPELHEEIVQQSDQNLLDDAEDLEASTDKTSAVPYESLVSPVEAGIGNGKKIKKKKKVHSKKQDFYKDDNGDYDDGNIEDNRQQAEAEPGNIDHSALTINKDDRKSTDEMPVDLSHESMLPSVDLVPERSSKGKKKRKKCSEVNTDFISNDLPVGTESDKKSTIDKSFNIGSDQLGEGDQSDDRKHKKKRRKKSKTEGIEENVNTEVKEDKSKSIMESVEKIVDAGSSEVRTLSSGLIIEDLGRGGNSRGKKAAAGKTVKVQFVVKLKENGHVIDSNIGKSPYKFRLGDKEVIEGLNVGVDGMRVGDKRRLIIPPSMSSGGEGAGENIPPNSWLVYDVDLVGVH